ncbi:MAG TPA: S9 family peptidase [Terriglobales bacterium]
MRRVIVSACLLACAVFLNISAVAQAKHPFTFEDMMSLKRVGEPEPSPDGKWVLFSAMEVDLSANTRTPHVWVVPLETKTETQGPSTSQGSPSASPASVGMTERKIIKDQDADRPRWAPDGKRFLFLSKKEDGSQVWIADFDAATGTVTGTHKLTSIATEADGPIWSPDGKNIAFTSDVYPECDRAPEQEQDCNAKKLAEAEKSPVKALIFTRLLYRHWNAYKEGKRTHIFVVAADACTTHVGADATSARAGEAGLKGGGTAETSRASLDRAGEGTCPYAIPRDLTPGDYDSPVFSLGGQDNYTFSPDGQELCYTSNHDKVEAISTNNDLWIVPVNVGTAPSAVQPKNITADNPASDSTPLYSPDGKYIAYRAQQRPGYESDRFRLMLYDRKTGKKSNLTDDFDRWVGTFTWAPDSSEIFLVAENKGQSPIYSISFREKSGRISALIAPQLVLGFNDDLTITKDGTQLFFTKMSLQAPIEIHKANPRSIASKCVQTVVEGTNECAAAKEEPVTYLNDAILSQVSMSPLEPFWFTGAHNDKVEGFLIKPPNFDANKKYPVKFLIHGGPQGAWGDDWSYRWNPELFAANGYVVVMINFHGSTGYGQKFIDAINGDWGGAPFEDLMKGLDYAEQHYPFIDKDRECALGASYGGYMANWVLGHTNRFKCIVTHDGMFNSESAWGTTEELWFNEWEFKGTPYTNREMYRKWSPHLAATNFKTPTLVVHGQRDYRLDVSEGFQLFTTLQRQGVPSKMLYFPDEGHWVLKPQNSRLWYQTVNDWVDHWTTK